MMNWETGLKRGPFSDQQVKTLNELLPGMDYGQVQWLSGFLSGVSSASDDPPIQAAPGSGLRLLSNDGEPVWILYGTHTGNSERLAKLSAKRIEDLGIAAKVSDMGSFKVKELRNIKRLLIIVSTHGIGEPPIQASELYEYLHGSKAPELKQLEYSVLALGDTAYTKFCQTGKDFDGILARLGAQRICERVDCDVDFEDDYTRWMEGNLAAIASSFQSGNVPAVPIQPAISGKASPVYDRKHPFGATVSKKINLNGRHSSKETIHLELDLSNSGLRYEPGDSLGVYASNANRLIEPVLNTLHFTGEELVDTYLGKKTLLEALTTDYELTPLTSISLNRYAELTGSTRLGKILNDNTAVVEYLYGRDLFDLIREVPFKMAPEVFISLLRKNSPRMYSIASSQDAVDDEVHILASVVRYEAYGRYKEGHCTSFLAGRISEDDQLQVFVDANSRFKLPLDPDMPVIMVGAGTGVAPYRAFIQQRGIQDAPGKSWLFFGERNFTTDFYYQTEWLQYLKEGTLTRADVAFSRDQAKKVYVQHRMLEQGRELFKWLEEGAHFYVCGDAQKMAKDVDHALKEIIQTQGGMTREKAEEYVKCLQVTDRYQADIY
ncbi:assimilatory sulfite reductase (NADPH) flavoprotein subunit [Mucilaginibacter ginsenosidivorans]|jgi:sulfite reductase (NADPH) flavoprotein alpha-component|nr:assimilatory sulfite reductase (NADPH) flavoprotein subunit [Mucilaginibacter ginsenosidivorans]